MGVIGAMIVGTSFPVFSIVFSEAVTKFTDVPPSKILGEIHPIAGAFLAIGFGLGTANFFKVSRNQLCNHKHVHFHGHMTPLMVM